MRAIMHHWVRAGTDLLFPPRCAVCKVDLPSEYHDSLLCVGCRDRLGPTTRIGCRRCGGKVEADHSATDCCPLCEKVSLWFDMVVVLGDYHAGLQEVVVRMKRPVHHALSVAMGRFLAQQRSEELMDIRPDFIVPIPMHWTRWLGRAMNSPELLGGCLSRFLGAPMRRRLLVRRRNTLPQKDLLPKERIQNMRGAFRVRRGIDLQNARILLVDDVLTTGATCSEAAKMLKKAGAAMVAVAVVAKAQGIRQNSK
jgi:ComF family protein